MLRCSQQDYFDEIKHPAYPRVVDYFEAITSSSLVSSDWGEEIENEYCTRQSILQWARQYGCYESFLKKRHT